MDTMSTPTREQAMAALVKANHVRLANSVTLKQLRCSACKADGLTEIASILRHGDLDGPLGAIRVRRLLLSVPWVGHDHARRILEQGQVFADRPLRRLSVRQTHLLAGALDAAAKRARARRPL